MKPESGIYSYYKECRLCPRMCGVDRTAGKKGICRSSSVIKGARAALHMWEEPCISGEEGSGAVFFSGCSVGCIFCQNKEISGGEKGTEISVEELVRIFFRLQEQKANNINLVTAGHFVPTIAEALKTAKEAGLAIPVVYNSSGYERVETLRMLEGLIDIYLPDFKYMDPEIAKEYSHAADYPEIAKAAITEMVRQVPETDFDDRGIMKKGVIVRHLLLPGHVRDSKAVVSWLYETYGDSVWISMMNQYTPMESVREHPLLGRKVKKREYEALLDHAIRIGVENGFFQEGPTVGASFIPAFNGEGIER